MDNHRIDVIRQAEIADVESLVPLFDAYRQFYGNTSAPEACRVFLFERFKYRQSIIFIAFDKTGIPSGFTQLFPSFSSGSLKQTFILNDLFVTPAARKQGIATRLLSSAADHAQSTGAARLTLSTQLSNQTAQQVYETNGWKRDVEFCVYHFPLKT